MAARFEVTYHVRSTAADIAARARAIAVEQSVEMPVEAIHEPAIVADIVGEVAGITEVAPGQFEVRIALATATVGGDAAQLLNMAFGNVSLQDDVVLHDMSLPPELEDAFGGPGHGIAGLRARVGAAAGARALTCSAIKPQGLPAARLAELVARLAAGGVDFVKDDHGLADQVFSRFADRVQACAAAARGTGTRYVPSLSGSLDDMRAQLRIAAECGLDSAMVAPMLMGPANMLALVRAHPGVAFFAHPTMGGAARIAPDLLIGKLFRLFGADVVIFPNHGGRFGYTPQTCLRLAENARKANPRLRPAIPAPAGGMTVARTAEILDFYGPDTMLLIGGSLLAARDRLTEQTAAFTDAVARHAYRAQ